MSDHRHGFLMAVTSALLAFGCLQAGAQKPTTPAVKAHTAAAASQDGAWLAEAHKLYYSSSQAGLQQFECNVHPDWSEIFATAGGVDQDTIATMQSIRIKLRANMKGEGTAVLWNQSDVDKKTLPTEFRNAVNQLHQSMEQMLTGFLQFWTPFVDGTTVPTETEGLELSNRGGKHVLHAKADGTDLTEIFSSNLVLEEYNVKMTGMDLHFAPEYKSSTAGLLVSRFKSHLVQNDSAQDMVIDIDYETVNGFQLPSKLSMEVVGTGKFTFKMDGCTTTTLAAQ